MDEALYHDTLRVCAYKVTWSSCLMVTKQRLVSVESILVEVSSNECSWLELCIKKQISTCWMMSSVLSMLTQNPAFIVCVWSKVLASCFFRSKFHIPWNYSEMNFAQIVYTEISWIINSYEVLGDCHLVCSYFWEISILPITARIGIGISCRNVWEGLWLAKLCHWWHIKLNSFTMLILFW
jgi:hypothetical protein